MKIKIGDIVESQFGQGPIVAMSKSWCIHEDEAGNEAAVEWADVKIVPTVDMAQSEITEIDYMPEGEEADSEPRFETERKEPGQTEFDLSEQT